MPFKLRVVEFFDIIYSFHRNPFIFLLKNADSKASVFNINSLPEEILGEIFGYLTQNELGQIARYVYFIQN